MSRAQRFVYLALAIIIGFYLAVILMAGLYALAWRYA